jgi:hypothetical protein
MNKKNSFLDKFKKVIWILTPFILIIIIFMLLFRCCNSECFDCNEMNEKIDNIEQKIKDKDCLDCEWESTVDIANDTLIDGEVVNKPTANCRAHFSGLLMTDNYADGHKTEIYRVDKDSEYVGEGEYPRAILAFPKTHASTFDGIAIDKGTRVIIYSEENFKGDILMDETGPAIITNKKRIEESVTKSEVINNNKKIFKEPLNSNYPPSCRKLSKSNMFEWSQGSLKVICNE